MAKQKQFRPMVGWMYDVVLWSFSILVDLFFREVHPRGSWRIPRRGPILFVAAPHANQFVDFLILVRVVRSEARRRIAFLIAEKSYKRKFIGTVSKLVGTIPVARALDSQKPGKGKIYLPDVVNQPTLLRGYDTDFEDSQYQVGGLVVLPTMNGQTASAEIAEIRNKTEIILKKPFKGADAIKALTGRDDVDENGKIENESMKQVDGFEGTKFKVAPHVDQAMVYDEVFGRLNAGGCVGIFPEGGSHDRTDLLPLKAGVAIMALGALAAKPDCGVVIMPCGMNYFHAHKFRSRAVIEFGPPVEISPELVEMYKSGQRREAVGALLETVHQSLVAVTVTGPDYETMMVIQAARRLYNPYGKKLPLPLVVELNRRLVKGYEHYKDDPRIQELKKSVMDYNSQLRQLGIRDHQVEYAKFSLPTVVFTLLYRLSKLITMAAFTLPGLVLFAPVFIVTKMISRKKAREALAASTVKLQGRDVMATWKLLVALAFAPLLYAFYTTVLTIWTYHNRVQGQVPEWVPLWMVVLFGVVFFPTITFAALRIGEVGIDILKSIRPLILSLNPSSANTIEKLRQRRIELSKELTDVINTLGPDIYPDFDAARIVADPFRDGAYQARAPVRAESSTEEDPATPGLSRANTEGSIVAGSLSRRNTTASQASEDLPRNESFHNLSNIGFFATRPPSPELSRSRSSSNNSGVGLSKLSTLDQKGNFEKVSRRIQGALRERHQRRRSSGAGESGSEDGDGRGVGEGLMMSPRKR